MRTQSANCPAPLWQGTSAGGLYPDFDHAPGKMIYARSTDGINWVTTDLALGVPFLHNRAVGMAVDPRGLPALAYLRLGKLWYATLEDGHWVQTAVGAYSGYPDSHGGSHFRLAFDRVGQPAIALFDPGTTSILLCRPVSLRHPPVAIAQDLRTPEDTPLALALSGTDADGDTLTLTLVSTPAHGTLTGTMPGFTYTPAANFFGSDSFQFQVDDGHEGISTATISITVTPVNDPPVAVDDSALTDEDTSVNIPVLRNDSDVDGDTLTVTGVTQGTHGSVTLNLDGTLNYTPNANFNGTDSFTYTVSDGPGATATATVTVTVTPVNDDPTAVHDSATTPEDTPVTIAVLTNDSDVDGDALTLASVTQGAHGAVDMNTDGTVTYTPAADFNGGDTFTYTVSDGSSGSATATVSVTVTAVNDPPVAADGNATGQENTPIDIPLHATDVDGDALTFSIVTLPLRGTLSTIVNNRVTYTPAQNYFGLDSFTFRAGDGRASDDGVVTIDVTGVNDPPAMVPVANQTVNEGAELTFSLSATDANGDTLTFSSPNLPAGATLNSQTGAFGWTPNYTQAGTYGVTFHVTDPSGASDSSTATITVVDLPQNVNRDPDCSHARPSISEIWPPDHKKTVVIEILGVTDPDGDPVSISITKILQDEPTNTLGDADTWVDGGGIGTSRGWVRAERSGTPKIPGNGRVYEIFFTVTDGKGGWCSNSVKVGVPHDQGKGPAIDDDIRYDSTVPGGPRVN